MYTSVLYTIHDRLTRKKSNVQRMKHTRNDSLKILNDHVAIAPSGRNQYPKPATALISPGGAYKITEQPAPSTKEKQNMKQNVIRILVLLLAVSAIPARGDELPRVKPSAVGMSEKKLAEVDTAVSALVTRKRLAGAIVMVARHGKVVLQKSYGQMDIETGKLMRDDTIVRIYSMTKAKGHHLQRD